MQTARPSTVTWQTLSVILRGLLWSSAFILLWAWLAVAVQPFDQRIPFTIPQWLRPLGIALDISGALLAASCIATFVTRGRGTPAPFDPPRVFVATGPYRYVRNPMYLGATAVLLGVGLLVASPAIVLLGAFFLLATHLFVLLYEEPALTRRFGESYLRYKGSVNRWLPRPR